LSELQNNAESIQCDIGGIQIERTAFLQDINNLIKSVQFIQVRGLPGSGKSVLLKQLAQQALDKGPVLFLRAEQLEEKAGSVMPVRRGYQHSRYPSCSPK
jgi:ABC-type phosphate/phosphonate transport system ATPase subunit